MVKYNKNNRDRLGLKIILENNTVNNRQDVLVESTFSIGKHRWFCFIKQKNQKCFFSVLYLERKPLHNHNVVKTLFLRKAWTNQAEIYTKYVFLSWSYEKKIKLISQHNQEIQSFMLQISANFWHSQGNQNLFLHPMNWIYFLWT